MRRLVLTLPIGGTTCQDCPFLAPDWSAARLDHEPMGMMCTNPAWADTLPDLVGTDRHEECLAADGGEA